MNSIKPNEDNKEDGNQEANGHADPILEKENDSSRFLVSKKVYTCRNSILTDMMKVNHFRSLYCMSAAFFTVFVFYTVVHYLAAPELFFHQCHLFRQTVVGWKSFIATWLSFDLYTFVIYLGFRCWIKFRNAISTMVIDKVFLFLYVSAVAFMFIVPAYVMLTTGARPFTNFILVLVQLTNMMKAHSFVRESVPRVLQSKLSTEATGRHDLYPTAKHYLYFIFIPVLIYRKSYPRNKDISLTFICHNLFLFFGGIFVVEYNFFNILEENFGKIGTRQFTASETAEAFGAAIFAGFVLDIGRDFVVFHAWTNLSAEIFRFGDREFYQDYWNSTSFPEYYRRINTIVNDWIHAYIYRDIIKRGYSKSVCFMVITFLSAVVHEYLITLTLGFCCPVMLVVYSGFGVILWFLSRKRTGHFWNYVLWVCIHLGSAILAGGYSLEWFARRNCPRTTDSLLDIFVPRSWNSMSQPCIFAAQK